MTTTLLRKETRPLKLIRVLEIYIERGSLQLFSPELDLIDIYIYI